MPDTIALLRGVNVGGHGRLPMAQLRTIAESCGHRAVRSYIQSGNLVFDRADPDLLTVARGLERAIREVAGVSTTAVLRTREQFLRVAARHPFEDHALELKHLHVVFLSGALDRDHLAAFDPADFAPEEVELVGEELYLHVPGGMAKTKVSQAFLDRRLGVSGTGRNWRTVGKLLELVG